MNCEEFQMFGLDLNQSDASAEERAAALEHFLHCPRCAGLVDSWGEARAQLFLLAEATRDAQASPRLEMRLRQEFRARRKPFFLRRRSVVFAAWALAAAVLIAVGVYWENWLKPRPTGTPSRHDELALTPGVSPSEELLIADGDTGAFTLLPGSLPLETESAAIMQVRMQRGALGALGLPVDQERAADWISVDLLVGEDGVPEAVRLHQEQSAGGLSQ